MQRNPATTIANLARSSDTISMPKVQTYGEPAKEQKKKTEAEKKARIIKFVPPHT